MGNYILEFHVDTFTYPCRRLNVSLVYVYEWITHWLSHIHKPINDTFVTADKNRIWYKMLGTRLNSLWPNDTIWPQACWSTSVQVIASLPRHHTCTWTNVGESSMFIRPLSTNLFEIQFKTENISFKKSKISPVWCQPFKFSPKGNW